MDLSTSNAATRCCASCGADAAAQDQPLNALVQASHSAGDCMHSSGTTCCGTHSRNWCLWPLLDLIKQLGTFLSKLCVPGGASWFIVETSSALLAPPPPTLLPPYDLAHPTAVVDCRLLKVVISWHQSLLLTSTNLRSRLLCSTGGPAPWSPQLQQLQHRWTHCRSMTGLSQMQECTRR